MKMDETGNVPMGGLKKKQGVDTNKFSESASSVKSMDEPPKDYE